ncbi:MAG: AAA family ATPase [Spiroplasma sp.]
MKEIKFSDSFFTEQTIQFHNNMAIIIGDNGSGKTTLLNTLEKGFKGKSSKFMIDNEPIAINDYQIIYLKEYFNLKENLKLTKTSGFRNDLIQNINQAIITTNNIKYKLLLENLERIEKNFLELLNQTYFKNENAIKNQLCLKPLVESFSINNLVDKMLKIQIYDKNNENIIDEDNYSHFFLRILLFNILKNTLQQKDKLRPTVILFDLPELYGTPKFLYQINNYLKQINKIHNTIIIITSNSPEYLNLLNTNLLAINLITNQKICFIKNFEKIIREAIICYSFCDSNIQDLATYKSNLNPLIDKEDIAKETKYIESELYQKIISSLFAEKIELWFKEIVKITNTNEYIIQYKGNFKDLIFLNNILLNGFNINCQWKNSNIIPNFIKLVPYLNN